MSVPCPRCKRAMLKPVQVTVREGYELLPEELPWCVKCDGPAPEAYTRTDHHCRSCGTDMSGRAMYNGDLCARCVDA